MPCTSHNLRQFKTNQLESLAIKVPQYFHRLIFVSQIATTDFEHTPPFKFPSRYRSLGVHPKPLQPNPTKLCETTTRLFWYISGWEIVIIIAIVLLLCCNNAAITLLLQFHCTAVARRMSSMLGPLRKLIILFIKVLINIAARAPVMGNDCTETGTIFTEDVPLVVVRIIYTLLNQHHTNNDN